MKSLDKAKSVVNLHINGETKEAMVRSGDTLLYTLREQLGLTGAKQACANGDCGACTVLSNNEPVHACLCLTVEMIDQSITTIEGLSNSPIAMAFIDRWAIQCGYCTPGFILNTHALALAYPEADEQLIDKWMQSNLCRCTGYHEIKEAIQTILQSTQMSGESKKHYPF